MVRLRYDLAYYDRRQAAYALCRYRLKWLAVSHAKSLIREGLSANVKVYDRRKRCVVYDLQQYLDEYVPCKATDVISMWE